jgi:hypothetical protein
MGLNSGLAFRPNVAEIGKKLARHGAALARSLSWSMIRKSEHRFSLATNAKRLRADHAQTIE